MISNAARLLSFAPLCLLIVACVAGKGRMNLRGVFPDRTTAPIFARVTLELDLDATFENPFDSKDIRVDAEVVSPSGKTWNVPGFYYEPQMRCTGPDSEVIEPAGPPGWQVRLSFMEPGPHRVTIFAKNRAGKARSEPITIHAVDTDAPGMIRRHGEDHRYFVTDRGETIYLVGCNVCWGGAAGSSAYDTWLEKYARNGCNFFRIWLSPHWVTTAMNTRASGFDGIDQANAWRLDYILGLAERKDLRVMLAIDSFNILRTTEREHGEWENSPYNADNGGPAARPVDYFKKRACRRAFKDRLRYMVARYGYSPNVLAWEFWNEVDIIDDYNSRTVASWHRSMAKYVRKVDPWDHLRGTSFASPDGDPRVDRLSQMDFVQSHHYGATDIPAALGRDIKNKEAADTKPHFHGEFGVSSGGHKTAEDDPQGIHLHNALYSSVGLQQAGTPMSWWWDSYIEPLDLYHVYGAFSRWIDGFDFVRQKARPINAVVLDADGDPMQGPVAIETAAGSWKPAKFNRPVTVALEDDGEIVAKTGPLSKVLHGLVNHPDLHNPATFVLDLSEPTLFKVIIDGVSGHGGASLRIMLDGEAVIVEDFVDLDGKWNTDTMTDYNGAYSLEVPAGQHTILVENVGTDWCFVRYRLHEGDALTASGLAGETQGLIWVHNTAYVWSAVSLSGRQFDPITGARLELCEMKEGDWTIEHWDTQDGEVIFSEVRSVHSDGVLTFELPDITWDAAFRLRFGNGD